MKREFTQEQKEHFKANALQAKKDLKALEESSMSDLVDPETFKHFIEVQRCFTEYSVNNRWLIFSQCMKKGLAPQKVASYTTWKKLHHQVKKGEKAIKIFAPCTVKKVDVNTNVPATNEELQALEKMESKEGTIYTFKVVSVFEIKQTEGDPLSITEAPQITWQQAIKEAKQIAFPEKYKEAVNKAIKAMEEKAAAEKAINKESAIDAVEVKQKETNGKEEATHASSSYHLDIQENKAGTVVKLQYLNANGFYTLAADLFAKNGISFSKCKQIAIMLKKTCGEEATNAFLEYNTTLEECSNQRKHEINILLGKEESEKKLTYKKDLVDFLNVTTGKYETKKGYTTTVNGVEFHLVKVNDCYRLIDTLTGLEVSNSGLRFANKTGYEPRMIEFSKLQSYLDAAKNSPYRNKLREYKESRTLTA